MKHLEPGRSRTLSLIVGTVLLLILATFLIVQINQFSLRDNGGDANEQLRRSRSEQQAILKSDSEIASGQVTRSINGQRSFLNIEISELSELSSNRSYVVYFSKSDSPDDNVLIAQLGEPQQVNGQPKYIVTGWGPRAWVAYDMVELREAGPISNQTPILTGSFTAVR
jgi:hypothetical protein